MPHARRTSILLLSALLAAAPLSAQLGHTRADTHDVEIMAGWSGLPESRLRVSDPLFAERIGSLAQRSVFARARLQAIGRSGMRVWVLTPDALLKLLPGAPLLPVGWVTLLPGGKEVAAVVDLDWLRRQHGGDDRSEAFLKNLDVILGHELLVHIGSIGPGRALGPMCLDPDPVPGALGCSVVEENLLAYSLDRAAPLRGEYRTLALRTGTRDDTATVRLHAYSAHFPELERDGWTGTSYHDFAHHAGLDTTTPFQRAARELWENGEHERTEAYYTRFMEGYAAGRPVRALEAELLTAMLTPHEPSATDRFRVRELRLVRAGKHRQARAMTRRRAELLAERPELSADVVAARVLSEQDELRLTPDSFEEAIETLYRRGNLPAVRMAYDQYLLGLTRGEPEAALRHRLLRWLRPATAR